MLCLLASFCFTSICRMEEEEEMERAQKVKLYPTYCRGNTTVHLSIVPSLFVLQAFLSLSFQVSKQQIQGISLIRHKVINTHINYQHSNAGQTYRWGRRRPHSAASHSSVTSPAGIAGKTLPLACRFGIIGSWCSSLRSSQPTRGTCISLTTTLSNPEAQFFRLYNI